MTPEGPLTGGPSAAEAQRVFNALSDFGPLLSFKLYRLTLPDEPAVPMLPCLDHEAMLHGGIPPHAAAYVQERASGDLHELVCIPDTRLIEVDTVSTWGECSEASRTRLLALLGSHLPDYRVALRGPTWWRGERRVAEACRAQVSLRDVLVSDDTVRVKAGIERLQTVSALMEKQSRVASWGVRTVMGPLLTATGVVTYVSLGTLGAHLGEQSVTALQYTAVTILGSWFLYYGLKAVQLTEMANRVWKRTAEYSLILAERRRIAQRQPR